jgi:hypothetical protein
MARSTSGKKVVRVESDESAPPREPTWRPTPEAKAAATKYRILAALLWLLAIGGEVVTIFWVLRQTPVNMIVLIAAIVVIGALAIGGSILWKRANRADPAPRSQPTRFFIQNQLGAIITIIAFLPLIILIFLNKDMDGKQKGIAGGVGIVVLLVAAYFGMSFDSPSVEQYDAETQRVIELTGQDLVFWTSAGRVYHLCENASAVNLESADNTIYSGTVGDAHAAGKERLTLQVDQEIAQCGLDPVSEPEAVENEPESAEE